MSVVGAGSRQLRSLLRPRPLADLLVWVLAAPLAFLLRIPTTQDLTAVLVYTLLGVLIKVAVASLTGLSRHAHAFLNPQGLAAIVRTIALGEVLMLGVALWLREVSAGPVPLSVPLIEGALVLAVVFGLRLYQRAQHSLPGAPRERLAPVQAQRALVLGAGEAGYLIARELLQSPERAVTPVAFLDDNPATRGQLILGLPVLGGLDELASAAARARASQLIIALPSAPGESIRRIHALAQRAGLPVRTMPSLSELLQDRPQVLQLRDVKLDDLLRRSPVQLNNAAIGAYLEGQTVLVTGAGGSIGSELARQAARYRPSLLILFGRGENSIFAIQQELLTSFPELRQVALIGDVRHATHLHRVFEQHRPAVVFHAAAHKHVPLMEDSPSEAVYNNVIGTRIVTELCLEFGVRRFVNISSDKAVNPSSVMGSSKRLAEMVVSVAATRVQPDQAFMSVRFGNVLGSRGSVVPTFLRQIEAGGPITITDPRMTRYFMTIPEASRLVLQAGALAGNGSVYVLKMGEPVRIVDLAQDLIRLSGRAVDIAYTGIRPGEKLYEELLTQREHVDVTSHADIFTARLEQPDPGWLETELERLEAYARDEDYLRVRRQIRRMIPESQLGE